MQTRIFIKYLSYCSTHLQLRYAFREAVVVVAEAVQVEFREQESMVVYLMRMNKFHGVTGYV